MYAAMKDMGTNSLGTQNSWMPISKIMDTLHAHGHGGFWGGLRTCKLGYRYLEWERAGWTLGNKNGSGNWCAEAQKL